MLKKLFSVEIDKYHRVITVFGLKFKFFYTKSLMKEIKLLRSIIEKSIDITKIPKATGNLRKVQLIKLEILKILKLISEKHNITFWLDYGTLIGAIRHKGCIPWDDDIDVAMMKEDYIKLWNVLREELKDTQLVVQSGKRNCSDIIKICYDKFNIDIFPMEYLDKRYETKEEKEGFINNWKLVTKKMLKKFPLERFYSQEINFFEILDDMQKIKNEVFGYEYKESEASEQVIRCAETMQLSTYFGIFDARDMFPLQEVEFEGVKFLAPCRPIDHLYQIGAYGEYGAVMNFPSIEDAGFAHTQRAHKNCELDLDSMYEYLVNLRKKYE